MLFQKFYLSQNLNLWFGDNYLFFFHQEIKEHTVKLSEIYEITFIAGSRIYSVNHFFSIGLNVKFGRIIEQIYKVCLFSSECTLEHSRCDSKQMAMVNIVDQTRFPGRQMTKAALDFTEEEFTALLKNQDDWSKLLPPGSIRQGKPDLILYNDMQGGIYAAHLWCNPGEKGTVYLKAFEITKNTPLSAARLKACTRNVSGWSNDPQQQFCTGMYFTIYEGEWEQFYGARFEVWFVPDSGGTERKLMEKNYKIQGWTR